ncbi:TMV resistance protein N-like isoform X3 [Ziziphus jujuba]|nr:TMV resistance protein N-like isoform X3 [Ziziphus jujuba]
MEKVRKWRAALIEASNLCGLYSEHFSAEVKLVQRIVEDISWKLPKYLSNEHCHEHVIGIGDKVKEIESLLSVDTADERIVGIWGMGENLMVKPVSLKLLVKLLPPTTLRRKKIPRLIQRNITQTYIFCDCLGSGYEETM